MENFKNSVKTRPKHLIYKEKEISFTSAIKQKHRVAKEYGSLKKGIQTLWNCEEHVKGKHGPFNEDFSSQLLGNDNTYVRKNEKET